MDDWLDKINARYGSDFSSDGKIILHKGRLFLYTGLETSLKADRAGLHIANDDLSLTLDGAQLFGKSASKNIFDLSRKHFITFFRGGDFSGIELDGPIIVRYRGEPVGAAVIDAGKLINELPTSRKPKFMK